MSYRILWLFYIFPNVIKWIFILYLSVMKRIQIKLSNYDKILRSNVFFSIVKIADSDSWIERRISFLFYTQEQLIYIPWKSNIFLTLQNSNFYFLCMFNLLKRSLPLPQLRRPELLNGSKSVISWNNFLGTKQSIFFKRPGHPPSPHGLNHVKK